LIKTKSKQNENITLETKSGFNNPKVISNPNENVEIVSRRTGHTNLISNVVNPKVILKQGNDSFIFSPGYIPYRE